MDKTILVDTDVNEGTEIGDVGDDSRQLHSRHEVFGRMHPRVELKGLSFATWIPSWLLKLFHDVGEGGESYCLRHIAVDVYLLALLRLFDEVGHGASAVVGHLLHDGIALGMDGTGVKGILSPRDAQEARTLLEGGGGTILLAVVHDILCQDGSQGQRRRSAGSWTPC